MELKTVLFRVKIFGSNLTLTEQNRLTDCTMLSISTMRKNICVKRKRPRDWRECLLLAERIKKSWHWENFTKGQFETFLFSTKKRSLLSETKKQ